MRKNVLTGVSVVFVTDQSNPLKQEFLILREKEREREGEREREREREGNSHRKRMM